MAENLDSCPRNDGGYLYPIGKTAGGTMYRCFLCESQVSLPDADGADAQFAASDIDPGKQVSRNTAPEQTRVLEHPRAGEEQPNPQGEEQREPSPGWAN